MKEIFISHTWTKDILGRDNHNRCKLLCDYLKKLGYSVWFDHYDMQSNIDNSIMLSINECKVFLVCLTMEYCNKINNAVNNNLISDNCFKEWNYALYKKKIIIPVLMEPRMVETLNKNDGAIQMYLNTLIYLDISHDDYNSNDFDLLCKFLRKHSIYNTQEKNIKQLKETASFNSFLEYILDSVRRESNSPPRRKRDNRRFLKSKNIRSVIYI